MIEINESYRNVNTKAPSNVPGFTSTSDALAKGLLGGLTPEGLFLGGPLVLGPLAVLSMSDPCLEDLRETEDLVPKLTHIVDALDLSRFSKHLRSRIQQHQDLERSKQFNTGWMPYDNSSVRKVILEIYSIEIKLRDRIGLDFSCHPSIDVMAHWKLRNADNSEDIERQATFCAGRFFEGSFLDWYSKPAQATEEINLALGRLANNIAAQVTSGYLVNECK